MSIINEENTCPKCGSKNIEYDDNTVHNPYVFYECKCLDCNQEYEEIHKMTFEENKIVD